MKKILSTLALAALVVLPASAQYNRFVPNTLIAGGTNVVAAFSTNTYSLTVDVSEFSQVSVQISGMLLSSNFCKPRLDFCTSADGSAYCTTNLIAVSCLGGLSSNAYSTAAIFCYNTNLNVEGLNSLKLVGVANNDNHGIISNLTVNVGGKKLVTR